MRSSIACARCRRSKVKCINGGINTVCRACESSGRECTYPPPAVPGHGGGPAHTPKRETLAVNATSREGMGEMPKPKRQKKTQTIESTIPTVPVSRDSKELADALDSEVLTPKVWSEVFDIFQLHFSTDLPFLHPPTLLRPLKKATMPQPAADPTASEANHYNSERPLSAMVLLGVLTLTARFHPDITAFHSRGLPGGKSDPIAASEYYANALRYQLAGAWGSGLGAVSLERIQGLCMLALYEWGMCRGMKAWIFLGVAIRTAQAIGLHFEQELDDLPLALSSAMSAEAQHLGVPMNKRKPRKAALNSGESFVQKETRRRAFWSCFLLDRYLSSGKYRPQMLEIKDIRVQLPCSERAFLFGERVKTEMLGEDWGGAGLDEETLKARRVSAQVDEAGGSSRASTVDGLRSLRDARKESQEAKEEREKVRWEVGEDEGVQSWVVKIVELWGRITKWSCAGGRRNERYPPWDNRSTFAQLRNYLSFVANTLPRNLTFSPANLSAHITSRTSTPYCILHTLYFLCLITIHREYVPFLPLRCKKPQGPLDPPLLPPDKYDIPAGFWDESAKECFKAARDMMELARACDDWGVLIETPIVGFAIYTAAFVGVYCLNFPHMDPDGYMSAGAAESQTPGSDRSPSLNSETGRGVEEARRAVGLLANMRPRLKMANGWFRTIKRMHRYFQKIKKDYRRNSKALASSGSGGESESSAQHNLSLRQGGIGGGLEEYKLLEKSLKEFGNISDDDDGEIWNDDDEDDHTESEQGRNSLARTGVKSEMVDGAEGTADAERTTNGRERWIAINSVVAAAARQQEEQNNGANVQDGSNVGDNEFSTSQNPPTSGYQSYSSHQQYYPSPRSQNINGSPHISYLPLGNNVPFTPPQSTSSPSMNSAFSRADGPYPGIPARGSYPQDATAGFAPSPLPGMQPLLPPQQQRHHSQWDAEVLANRGELFMSQLNQRLGGEDVAAFVDGTGLEEWNTGDSWLRAVWNGAQL